MIKIANVLVLGQNRLLMPAASTATPIEPASSRWRIRFSLGGLILCVTCVALFLGVRNLHDFQGNQPWLAVATLLLVVGVLGQVADLRWAAQQVTEPDVRARVLWEQVWRLLACGLLILYAVEITLQSVKFEWFRTKDMMPGVRWMALAGWTLLVIALLQTPRSAAPRYDTIFQRSVAIAGILLSLLWAFALIFEMTVVDVVMNTAIRGVEMSQPARRGAVVIYAYPFYHEERRQIELGAQLAFPLTLVVFVGGWLSLHLRSRAVALALGITATLSLLSLALAAPWAHALIASIQFHRTPLETIWQPYYFCNALLLYALLTAAITAVLLRDSAGHNHPQPVLSWRRPFGGYVHERWIALTVLGMATLRPVWTAVVDTMTDFPSNEWSYMLWSGQFLFASFHLAAAMLPLLIVCFAQWFRKTEHRVFPPLTMSPLPWVKLFMIAGFVAILIPVMSHVALWLIWTWFFAAPI